MEGDPYQKEAVPLALPRLNLQLPPGSGPKVTPMEPTPLLRFPLPHLSGKLSWPRKTALEIIKHQGPSTIINNKQASPIPAERLRRMAAPPIRFQPLPPQASVASGGTEAAASSLPLPSPGCALLGAAKRLQDEGAVIKSYETWRGEAILVDQSHGLLNV